MSDLVLAIATHRWKDWLKCVESWYDTAGFDDPPHHYVVADEDVLVAYQEALEKTTEPIIGHIHDDVNIFERGWDERVLREFVDDSIGMVCFGGGRAFGSPDLYRVPYVLQNLGRSQFMSNLRNAEAHGTRFTGECDIACADGFAIFVRRKILDKWGGWPIGTPVSYFCYDMVLSAEVRRQGYRSRLVGVDCEHLSGKTASMLQLKDDHAAAHLWLYENYRDVLPFAVE